MKSQFNKTMNVVDVLFLAIGAMLGWGWVVLSGDDQYTTNDKCDNTTNKACS